MERLPVTKKRKAEGREGERKGGRKKGREREKRSKQKKKKTQKLAQLKGSKSAETELAQVQQGKGHSDFVGGSVSVEILGNINQNYQCMQCFDSATPFLGIYLTNTICVYVCVCV